MKLITQTFCSILFNASLQVRREVNELFITAKQHESVSGYDVRYGMYALHQAEEVLNNQPLRIWGRIYAWDLESAFSALMSDFHPVDNNWEISDGSSTLGSFLRNYREYLNDHYPGVWPTEYGRRSGDKK